MADQAGFVLCAQEEDDADEGDEEEGEDDEDEEEGEGRVRRVPSGGCSWSGVSTTVGDIDTGTRTMPPPDSKLSSRIRSAALSPPRARALRQPLRASPPSTLLDRGERGERFLGASGFRGLTTTATFGPRKDMCNGGTRGGSP